MQIRPKNTAFNRETFLKRLPEDCFTTPIQSMQVENAEPLWKAVPAKTPELLRVDGMLASPHHEPLIGEVMQLGLENAAMELFILRQPPEDLLVRR